MVGSMELTVATWLASIWLRATTLISSPWPSIEAMNSRLESASSGRLPRTGTSKTQAPTASTSSTCSTASTR